ncbi:TetR/AcrR family transcriptional regulator [Mucilaginibacter agri]|uniref:TetR family transcriptional regulator n=1 Tax=Mucilaginibacter agri TaxID=2695265 RepID=A0A966DSD4_9SPHI|nr:TetR/AcrR family transcriptional regulator [Mucilaginibacter agri]NCD69490.1 TetR family transcriptional regulator [Mucilaginibacter agri]
MDKEKIDKKDHILDVAERVFSEVGFDGASTRMISGEAGVNMAMLNYYFGSKEGLFLAIFERRIATFKTLLVDINSDEHTTAWEKIEKYIEMYVERIFSNNCFQKMLYQELSMGKRGELTDNINKILMINVSEFFKIVQSGIDSGEFRKDVDVQMVTATMYGVKNYIMNTPYVSSVMFGFDIKDEEALNNIFKPRLKNFLKALLKPYLVIEHDHTNK